MVQNNPTPFDVGRAFVHQYYTLLHRAPGLLHRFYSTDSTFIHGGVDRPGSVEQPAVGPENISKRIQELELRDCHAKIRQVDSHPTIGSGVVVQVTGELSNNGNRMRRFMQTFVLAPREPKKYYVQNDIFRYQDEVFEDQSDEDDRSSSQVYNDMDKASNADSSSVAPVQQQVQPVSIVEVQHQSLPPRRAPEPQQVIETPVTIPNEVSTTIDSSSNVNQPTKVVNSEGHSYAGIAKLTPNTSAVASVSTPVTVPTPVAPTVAPPSTVKSAPPVPRANLPSQRGPNDGYHRQNYRSNQWSNETSDGNYRPSNSTNNHLSAPNEQQVFVGSLIANMTREDLIECFSAFGKVLDAKIINHADFKRNYGFVAFEDAATATKVHQMQHVTYKDHQLNVEPKTQKQFNNQHNSMGNPRHNTYQSRGGGRGGNRGGGGYRSGLGPNPRRGGGNGGYRHENPEENHPKVPSQS